jgi:hypothetical protein|nr:hypothetical protein [Neorhizobium tomejilense]
MKSEMPGWWEVKTKADTSLASAEFACELEGHLLGCAAKNAWISSYDLKTSVNTEFTVSEADSACNMGFIESRRSFTDYPEEDTHLWMPRTASQVEVVIDDLVEDWPRRMSRDQLRDAMAASLEDDAVICIVSSPAGSRRSTGVIAFRRELTICDQRATVGITVGVFHSEGTFVQRAALLGAFRAQIKADIEASYTSLCRAGVDLDFDIHVHASDNDNRMIRYFWDLATDAKRDAFDGGFETPDWLDLARLHGDAAANFPAMAAGMSP